MSKSVLVTGGCGYIGSHACIVLLEAGYDVIVIDNLSNGSYEAIRRVEKICCRSIEFVLGDIRDFHFLSKVFSDFCIDSVLHFAGLKSVSDSVKDPLSYYENNVSGTLVLCQAMKNAGVYKLVFSSSATVYGDQNKVPISESYPTGEPTNPYGRSKLVVEEFLRDLSNSDSSWSIALLRYFNPIGAHESGLIGEDPRGTPNNLLPYISQVASGRLEKLTIFGDDYPTQDGTGVRDYIHVVDLARGHLCALLKLEKMRGVGIWNLGVGKGVSVRQVVNIFEEISGKIIDTIISPRRPGDIAECWADTSKAKKELEWVAEYHLEDMIRSTWNWQLKNPFGYTPYEH